MKLNEIVKTEEEKLIAKKLRIEKICERLKLQNYTVRDDLKVDIDGTVSLQFRRYANFPINFGKVTGDFNCYSNDKLLTLEGFPEYVGGNIDMSSCVLISDLSYLPKHIRGSWYCGSNYSIRTLEGGPTKVDNAFVIDNTWKLESLEGCPSVGGDFYVNNINALKTLKGCPTHIGGDFRCLGNRLLRTLEYGPKKVGKSYLVTDSLGTFDFLPEKINGTFFFKGKNSWNPTNYLKLFEIEGVIVFMLFSDKISKIMNKHYHDDKNIAACQEELIESGYEKYAEF